MRWRVSLGLSLRLGMRLGLAFRRHDIERIARLFMTRLARCAATARLAIAILVAATILVIATVLIGATILVATPVLIPIAVAITIAVAGIIAVIVVAIIAVIAVALFNTIAEALVSVVGNIVFIILDLVVRAGIAARLTGLDETEIMLGVLVEILCPHPVTGQRGIAGKLNVFVENLGSIAADFDFRTIALIAAIGRAARFAPTSALALIVARPCFPAIHI
jgi:hypothetical protein